MLTKWITACSMAAMLVMLARPAAQTQHPGDKTPATAEQPSVAELWSEPEPDRDLYYGVGGQRLAPNPADTYTVLDIKIRGFSEGYTLSDSTEREWSAKLPPEAVTEVVASRLLWGVGFHQPPIYLVREWEARGATAPNPQLPARFREKNPDFHGLQAGESWSYKDNPFVGTREFAGLLVLQAIIENPDLKTSNNTIYKLKTPVEGAKRWYVIRDLGYSLGRAAFNSPRADIDAFERAPFIRGVTDGKVTLLFRRAIQVAPRRHQGGRRPLDLRAARAPDGSAMAGRLSRRGVRVHHCGTLHRAPEGPRGRRSGVAGGTVTSKPGTAASDLLRAVAFCAIGILWCSTTPESSFAGLQAPADGNAAAIDAFTKRVAGYTALQKKISATLPAVPDKATPKQLDDYQRALGQRLIAARGGAKQGDVFGPDMPEIIRQALAPSLQRPRGRACAGRDHRRAPSGRSGSQRAVS